MVGCAVDVSSNQEMLGERSRAAAIFGRMGNTNLYWGNMGSRPWLAE